MHGAMAVAETAPVEPFGLERAFREHQGRVFRAAYRITGNVHDAEDILQTVFLRHARQGEGFAAPDNPASYLYRAAINAALDVLRGRRERPDLPIDAADAEGRGGESPRTPEQVHEAAELRARLRDTVARLDPRPAEIFALRYLEGQGNRDIARALGISRVSVAVTLHRTRQRLQNELRDWKRGRS